MGMRELRGAIANELREIVGKRSLRVEDMVEWSTSEDVVRKNAEADETVIHCPRCGVWVAIASSKVPNAQAHGRAVARTVQPLVGHSESEGGRE